ncbi:MAG: ADP-ribosylglycohydrolase family protein [Candidatus Riflebacteria bacterium]|nr:ADP-ribosylglycohydrolase family protein [Candidatus Riflebacteria bacterium]
MTQKQIIGCILGTAAGDALGLPYEGLSRRRAAKMFGPPDRHKFLFGKGMISDDTEHTCMVAQALISSGGNEDAFVASLGWRFRFWFMGMPMGIGFATLRAILKLWLGFGAEHSGVFSAGNGPAMRAAIFGATFDDTKTISKFVRASTRITHTDPKAEYGALTIAFAARMARRPEPVSGKNFLHELHEILTDDGKEMLSLIEKAVNAADKGESTKSFADSLGLGNGVSGYVYHTVPVAIHAWLTNQRDFRSAITSVIECGGDADTTAAIVGGIVGSAVGRDGIPQEWLSNLFEWPRSVTWMENLGTELYKSLESTTKAQPPGLPFWGLLPRNLFALTIVLLHGFRRLFPPY